MGRLLDTPGVLLVALGMIGLALVAAHASEHWRAATAPPGLTSEVAALVVFLLGGLCVLGPLELAVALGVATSAVLEFKQPIHDLVRRVGPEDLYAALKLLVATFIVLPLLPRRWRHGGSGRAGGVAGGDERYRPQNRPGARPGFPCPARRDSTGLGDVAGGRGGRVVFSVRLPRLAGRARRGPTAGGPGR